MRKLSKQVLMIVIGQIVIAAGVALLLVANLGVDPISVFHTGVANTFNISFELALFIENIIATIIIFIVDKKYINVATVLSIFLISLTAPFFSSIYVSILGVSPALIVKLISVVIASVIISIGYNIYFLADKGIAPMDAVAELITIKANLDYKKVKVISDVTFLVVGYLLGGTVGVATVIVTLLIGPLIAYVRGLFYEPITRFINK